jgi:ferric-dicitrate binding protein FerR (iron transport regulator)
MLTLLSRIIALALTLSLVHSYTIVSLSAATAVGTAVSMGSIYVAGEVHVNGGGAFTGGTIFSDSTIDTGHAARAKISLDRASSIELAEETSLKLGFSDSSITGTLNAGRMRVSVPPGMLTSITASDVSLLADASQPATFSVKTEQNGVTLSVEAGQLNVTRGKATQVITAGQVFSTVSDSASQSASQQHLSGAGKVRLALGIGGAIALIAIILSGQGENQAPTEPCVVILSGDVHCP